MIFDGKIGQDEIIYGVWWNELSIYKRRDKLERLGCNRHK